MDPDSWDRRYAQDELVWSAEPNRFFAKEVEDLAPGRALDTASSALASRSAFGDARSDRWPG
jgi:hypothetical protein